MHKLAAVTLATLLYGCGSPVDTLRTVEPPERLGIQERATPTPSRASRGRRELSDYPTLPAVLQRIRWCESRNDYRARNPRSSASGAFQVITSTWDGHGGYRRAYLAPRSVQDRQALALYAAQGTRPWTASRSCWR